MFCNKNVNKYALNFPIHSGLRGRVSLPVRWIGVHLELKAVWTRNLILLLESIMVPLFCLTKQQHKRLVSAQSKRAVQRSEGVHTIALLVQDQRLQCPAAALPNPLKQSPRQAGGMQEPLCSPDGSQDLHDTVLQ